MFSLCVTLRHNRVPYLLYKHADYVKLILVNTGCWRMKKNIRKITRYCSCPDSNSSNMTHEALNHCVSYPSPNAVWSLCFFVVMRVMWVDVSGCNAVGDFDKSWWRIHCWWYQLARRKKKTSLLVDSWSTERMEHPALFFFVPPANCLTQALYSLTSANPDKACSQQISPLRFQPCSLNLNYSQLMNNALYLKLASGGYFCTLGLELVITAQWQNIQFSCLEPFFFQCAVYKKCHNKYFAVNTCMLELQRDSLGRVFSATALACEGM